VAFNLRRALGSRRVQLGALGVGALVGGVVYLKRKNAGAGAAASSTTDTSGSGNPFSPSAFPDTSGTDAANSIGNLGADIDQQFAGFAQTQSQILTALQNLQPVHSGTPSPPITTPPPHPVPKPPGGGGPTSGPPAAQYVTVVRYTSSHPSPFSTLSGIAGAEHTSVAALLKLNPGIKNPDLIRTGQKIRVK